MFASFPTQMPIDFAIGPEDIPSDDLAASAEDS